MLSTSNIRQINNQIADELRIARSFAASHQEKMEAYKRARTLKDLLHNRHEVTMPPIQQPKSIYAFLRDC